MCISHQLQRLRKMRFADIVDFVLLVHLWDRLDYYIRLYIVGFICYCEVNTVNPNYRNQRCSQVLNEVNALEIQRSAGIWRPLKLPVFPGQSLGRTRRRNRRAENDCEHLITAIVLRWYFLQMNLENCMVWHEFGKHMTITYGVGKVKQQAICTLMEVLLRVFWCHHIYPTNITISDFWLTYSDLTYALIEKSLLWKKSCTLFCDFSISKAVTSLIGTGHSK